MIDAAAAAIARKHPLPLMAAVLIGASAIAMTGASEFWFRVAGLLLTVAGILTVAWNVADTRKSIGERGLFDRVKTLFQRTHAVSVDVGAGIEILSGQRATFGQPTVEEQIASLREKVERETRELKERQDKLETDQSAQERRTQETIRNMANAGLDLTAIGVIWLIAGSVLTAVPDVMAGLEHQALRWLLSR